MSFNIKETHNSPATLGTKLAVPNVVMSNGTSLLDTTHIFLFICASLTFFLKFLPKDHLLFYLKL